MTEENMIYIMFSPVQRPITRTLRRNYFMPVSYCSFCSSCCIQQRISDKVPRIFCNAVMLVNSTLYQVTINPFFFLFRLIFMLCAYQVVTTNPFSFKFALYRFRITENNPISAPRTPIKSEAQNPNASRLSFFSCRIKLITL